MHFVLPVLLASCLVIPAAGQQKKVPPVFQEIPDEPGLPRVLVIGDSISIGYTLPLREALKGVANLHRAPENCASTWHGLDKLDAWLGDGHWDVIHFNWGLHDLKYIDEKGRLCPPPRGKQVTTIDQYEANLDRLVTRLERSGATLIWAATTPVPPGARGRFPGDDDKYNYVAARVMKEHGVAVDDLYAFVRSRRIPHARPGDVHFTKEGSVMLAGKVAAVIQEALKKRKQGP